MIAAIRAHRLLLAAALAIGAWRPAAALDTHRAVVERFIGHMAYHDAFDEPQLRALLAAAKSQPAIIAAMARPVEKTLPWYQYRPIFLNEKRIQEGVDFWRAHQGELDASSARTGVAPQYVVAILGVETYYGTLTGQYRVLDALTTLAFDYPSRSKFFRSELEQFLLLARDQGIDPLTATGSYAGAMGAPQFMPSAYRRYGLDASGDGRVDLWSNWPDVFDSVGYFLKDHGWTGGAPVLSDASVAPDIVPAAAAGALAAGEAQIRLSATVGSLQAQGVRIDRAPPADTPAVLIPAQQADGVHWRVGYENFYALTRYNRSPLYAMAVYELACALQSRVEGAPRPADAPQRAAIAGRDAAPRGSP
ncbi:MAG TPA: lytic murein transglycosylase B [Steroidobacteraceae bacterium]|nr:lytic murein transglycosylase B [Steroidobacteraceae bacterium]